LRSIIAVLEPGLPVSSKVLKEMMKPLYPDHVVIGAQDVCNMRWKVNRILDRMEKESESAGGSASSQSISDEENCLQMDNGLEEVDDIGGADAAQECAEPEPRSINNDVPQAQDPAEASYSSSNVMTICKNIASLIMERPDAAKYVGMLL
jgi:hypothetical protein